MSPVIELVSSVSEAAQTASDASAVQDPEERNHNLRADYTIDVHESEFSEATAYRLGETDKTEIAWACFSRHFGPGPRM